MKEKIEGFILTPAFYTKKEWCEKYKELLKKYNELHKELINKPDTQKIFIDATGKEFELILTKRFDLGEHYKEIKLNVDRAIEEINYLISNCDISNYQGEKLKNILKGGSDD